MDAYLWRPVVAKYWTARDIDYFTFHDLVEVNLVIDIVEENQRRADAAAAKEAANRARS